MLAGEQLLVLEGTKISFIRPKANLHQVSSVGDVVGFSDRRDDIRVFIDKVTGDFHRCDSLGPAGERPSLLYGRGQAIVSNSVAVGPAFRAVGRPPLRIGQPLEGADDVLRCKRPFKPARRKFKSHPIGYFHIALPRSNRGGEAIPVRGNRSDIEIRLRRATCEGQSLDRYGLPQSRDQSGPLQNPYRAHRQRHPVHRSAKESSRADGTLARPMFDMLCEANSSSKG